MRARITKKPGVIFMGSIAKAVLRIAVSALLWPLVVSPQAKTKTESAGTSRWDPSKVGAPLLRDPIWVYNDWSAYDELSLLGVLELAGLTGPDQKLPDSIRVKHGRNRQGKTLHYYLNYSSEAQAFDYPYAAGKDLLMQSGVEQGQKIMLKLMGCRDRGGKISAAGKILAHDLLMK